jgi:phenylpyruvate tautomerase PptA (4-oxalocrotonate tautomerase family)
VGVGVPIIRIEMLSGRTEDQKRELVDVFTREMARIAKCLAADVQVVAFPTGILNCRRTRRK